MKKRYDESSLKKVKIADIRPGMRGIIVEGTVLEKSEPVDVMTRYGPAKVAYAILEDETGTIRLNLWRKQIEVVNVGDRVRVINAFVKEFAGRLELNVGRDGYIEVLG